MLDINLPPNVIEALSFILKRAKGRFGILAVERIEAAFLSTNNTYINNKSLSQFQRPKFYIPDLKAIPWHDPTSLDVVVTLEEGYPIIRKELDQLLEMRKGFQPFLDSFLVNRGSWNAFYLRVDGHRFERNWELCPKTIAIIESIPRLGEMAMISALAPGTHIAPHCGPWNIRITTHLGLIIPQGCEFRVADETRNWEEGKCLVFDDSFEHEVTNGGSMTRFCLLVDVWHPDLTQIEIVILKEASHLLSAVFEEQSRIDRTANELEGKQWWT